MLGVATAPTQLLLFGAAASAKAEGIAASTGMLGCLRSDGAPLTLLGPLLVNPHPVCACGHVHG